MGRARKQVTLRLFMNNTPVGILKKLSSGALQFSYEPEWIESKKINSTLA